MKKLLLNGPAGLKSGKPGGRKPELTKRQKHIILIQDGASYHRSRAVKEFFRKRSDRPAVYRLPSCSPDYNPVEKLWKKIKEKEVHPHYFPTFESLKIRVGEGLPRFSDLKKEVLSLFVFYNKLKHECNG